ncbi:peptidoglycan-binding protein, partial [Streptomyces sp. NPDC002205]
MVAVAGFTSGLFILDEPRRDTALQDGRTGAPEESGRTPASLSPSASASTEPSAAKRASSSALPAWPTSTSATPAARIGSAGA